MFRTAAASAALGFLLVIGTGCIHRHHHETRKVLTLDAEHDDQKFVIVHVKPKPKRHCRKHHHHWHCHR